LAKGQRAGNCQTPPIGNVWNFLYEWRGWESVSEIRRNN